MKIDRISVKGFLGVRSAEVKLSKPIALFAGKNFAGKSSLQEAVRMALTGESVRVGVKKDYSQLVSEGETIGYAMIDWSGGRAAITLPNGTHELVGTHPPEYLHYVLDAQRFARLDPNERRAFLFGLMGLSASGDEVKRRLADKGCDATKVEAVMPLLRIGFDAACKEAKTKATEAKGAWRATTGETYGDKKGGTWRADKPVFDAKALEQAQTDLAKIEAEIEQNTTRLGELQGRGVQAQKQQAEITGLRQKAGMYARIQDKLNLDEKEIATWQATVQETREKAGAVPKRTVLVDATLRGLAEVTGEFLELSRVRKLIDPETGEIAEWGEGLIMRADLHYRDYCKAHGDPIAAPQPADPEAQAKLPEYEKALALYERAVANGKRDLAEADAAAKALDAAEKAGLTEVPEQGEIEGLKARIEAQKGSRRAQQATIADLQGTKRLAKEADHKTAKAAQHHADVQAWDKIADALAPDGIPGELLAAALTPLNDRLEQSSEVAEWMHIHVEPDMSIWAAYPTQPVRPYALLSESEKWRADAMIAEAIAHLSGIRLLVLDRFDVLDLKGREDLLYWLGTLADEGQIETALLFGTLKAPPALNFATIEAHWIDNGTAGQLKEAA